MAFEGTRTSEGPWSLSFIRFTVTSPLTPYHLKSHFRISSSIFFIFLSFSYYKFISTSFVSMRAKRPIHLMHIYLIILIIFWGKERVKLALCTPWRLMKAVRLYCYSSVTSALCGHWVVSLTLRPLYALRMISWCEYNRKLGTSEVKAKFLILQVIENQIVQPVI
jgi:hypothetical protein